jgi:predicted nucleic acid-binding Zn ribbon protein
MKTEAKTDNKTDKFCSDEDVTSFAKSKNRKRAKKVIMIE